MISLPFAFIASLLLGMRHATDPDHIVAVTTIVSREKSLRRSMGVGVLWGIGHTVTIFAVGGALVLYKFAFTPRLGLSMEFTVAIMLVVLGVLNLRPRGHLHVEVPRMRPFVIGVVHGLAGSAAATILILPLIDDVRWALVYLAVFGAGTVAGMALITMAIAAPSIYAGNRVAGLQRGLRLASGVASLAFGAYLGYKIGFVDGLFTAQAHWTPQ
jgi:hypothetical protein